MSDPRPTTEEQVKDWVAGDPKCPSASGECCPDFSCCDASLLAPREVREEFAKAFKEGDRKTMDHLCMRFLGGFVDTLDADVHIAGTGDA